MKTINNKTEQENNNTFNCYLPIFHGFYGSYWDEPDFEGEADHFNLPEKFPFYDYFNYKKYQEALSEKFCTVIEKSDMDQFIESITFKAIDSPQYYNFTNDKIDIEITVKKRAIKKYIYEHLPAFVQWLIDHHRSRDGFNSFYSHTFEDWKKYTSNFTNYEKEGYVCLTSILNFIAEQEQITEEILYETSYEVSVGEFYTEDFYKLIDEIEANNSEFINMKKVVEHKNSKMGDSLNLSDKIESIKQFVKDNYKKSNVKELTIDQFAEVEMGFMDTYKDFIHIEAIIEWQVQEIENNTLSLEL
jgi:hypothetical protein